MCYRKPGSLIAVPSSFIIIIYLFYLLKSGYKELFLVNIFCDDNIHSGIGKS